MICQALPSCLSASWHLFFWRGKLQGRDVEIPSKQALLFFNHRAFMREKAIPGIQARFKGHAVSRRIVVGRELGTFESKISNIW